MQNTNRRYLVPSLIAMLAGVSLGSQASDLSRPFPEASKGMVRHVILLPEVADTEARRVEIIAGKTLEADCNRMSFGARLSEQTLQGWGYTYYTVSALKGPISTRMACPPASAPREPVFVSAHFTENALVRYNPRLPLVVYAPEDVEIRYRVWKAGELTSSTP
ncbi:MAG: serine protease inhibitor ecotin [Candidatus Dactylopiibacterium sp.]|nr:serine protease inhibitor ecotin [Candidatus Dactylopiibacterium sp.]